MHSTHSQEESTVVSALASLSTLCFISFAFTFRADQLYHGDVVLNTLSERRRSTRRAVICALEPPGNVAREINLYRRAYFREFGISSASLYPALIPLVISSPGVGVQGAARLAGFVARAIEDMDLRFSGTRHHFSGDALYLGLSQGLPELLNFLGSPEIQPVPAECGCPAADSQFLLPGAGFFVCRTDGSGNFPATGDLPPPPPLSFRDCSVSVYRVDSGDGFRHATRWTLLARTRRKTGAGQ